MLVCMGSNTNHSAHVLEVSRVRVIGVVLALVLALLAPYQLLRCVVVGVIGIAATVGIAMESRQFFRVIFARTVTIL